MNDRVETQAVQAGSPLRRYASAAAVDEMLSGPETLRDHWLAFAEGLDQFASDELLQRWRHAERTVHDQGIMYNPHGDPEAAARPWDLDAIPLLIAEQEWEALAEGLVQRARLLDRIIADLYGEQLLLRRGLLPAELIHAHPGFVRSFRELPATGTTYLHYYSADLARAPDGRWWVMGDRSDSPLGAGYAVENRLMLSRIYPNLFHRCRVERLAGFFLSLRAQLQALAPRQRDNPRVVLLSQGPHSTNYFEDVYLARYLGLTLVEGGDLAVRGEQVCVKTLGGLLPVDVIFRRLSELYMDPLELGGEASVGVAGLLQAVRAGNVAIANGLGCGLIESPAFMPFLPELSKQLLGESLSLPSLATWWCGEDSVRRYVLDQLEHLTLHDAFRAGRRTKHSTDVLNAQPTAQRAALIQADPSRFVAQEHLDRSTAPVSRGESLAAGHVALRTFLVASGDGYTVMPGGLVRVSQDSRVLDRSILAGEGSKDTWVLSSRPVRRVSLLGSPGERVVLRRTGTDLPSRVADNVFWLGRYLERSECAARLLRTIFSRITGEWEAEVTPELVALLRVLAYHGGIEPGFVVEELREMLPELDEALLASVFDDHAGSLRTTLGELHRLASMVRDRLSLDSWQIIHGIERDVVASRGRARHDAGEMLALLHRLITELSAMVGMVVENMTRTLVWRFLDAGRRLERSLYTIALVQNTLVETTSNERAVLEAVVEVADSTMTYRSRYLTSWQTAAVLDLLLTDESNPRSLAFQLKLLNDHVENLPRDATQAVRTPEQRITMSALNAILLADVDGLTNTVRSGRRVELDRLLNRLGSQLPKLARLIANKYLVHAATPRPMAQ